MDALFFGGVGLITVEMGSPEKVGRKVVSGETPIARSAVPTPVR